MTGLSGLPFVEWAGTILTSKNKGCPPTPEVGSPVVFYDLPL